VTQQDTNDDDDEDEDDEEEEENDFSSRRIIAPVFKRKSERDTIVEIQKIEEEEILLEQENEKRKKEKAKESKELLKQEIKRSVEQPLQEAMTKDILNEDESEDDTETNAEEYEKWKLRELARIKREREERDQLEKEKQETDRRRKLTDIEIAKEDKNKLQAKPKAKWNFLQKYYHKGAFFRTFDDKDEIKNRWDFNQPTLEDHADKTILPAVMQVKNFGRASRTKYTHLVDQDTSKYDSPWMNSKDPLVQKRKKLMAGTGSIKK